MKKDENPYQPPAHLPIPEPSRPGLAVGVLWAAAIAVFACWLLMLLAAVVLWIA
jgi:hypothetical protein